LGLASTEGLGVADSQSKCDIFFKRGGELAILFTPPTGKKGMRA